MGLSTHRAPFWLWQHPCVSQALGNMVRTVDQQEGDALLPQRESSPSIWPKIVCQVLRTADNVQREQGFSNKTKSHCSSSVLRWSSIAAGIHSKRLDKILRALHSLASAALHSLSSSAFSGPACRLVLHSGIAKLLSLYEHQVLRIYICCLLCMNSIFFSSLSLCHWDNPFSTFKILTKSTPIYPYIHWPIITKPAVSIAGKAKISHWLPP